MKTHCACNRKECEGICKELHLFRQRVNENLDICPAAYDPEKEKRRRYKKE